MVLAGWYQDWMPRILHRSNYLHFCTGSSCSFSYNTILWYLVPEKTFVRATKELKNQAQTRRISKIVERNSLLTD